jgi:hypothetical protein
MTYLALVTDIAIALLTAALFGLAFAQVCRPWQAVAAGEVVRHVRLPLRARLRFHGVWLLGATLALLAAGAFRVLVTPWPFFVAAAAAVALLACPVGYTITAQGIAVGRTPLRRWTEFGGLTARNGWIYLQPVAGARGLLIRAPDRATTDELAAELRRLVRDAYKGQIGPYSGTLDRQAATSDEGEDPEASAA